MNCSIFGVEIGTKTVVRDDGQLRSLEILIRNSEVAANPKL